MTRVSQLGISIPISTRLAVVLFSAAATPPSKIYFFFTLVSFLVLSFFPDRSFHSFRHFTYSLLSPMISFLLFSHCFFESYWIISLSFSSFLHTCSFLFHDFSVVRLDFFKISNYSSDSFGFQLHLTFFWCMFVHLYFS